MIYLPECCVFRRPLLSRIQYGTSEILRRATYFNHILLVLRAFKDMLLIFQNEVRMICLPAGQTSRLQPLDKSVFGGLKKNYNDYVRAIPVDSGDVVKSELAINNYHWTICLLYYCFNKVTRASFPRHLAEVCAKALFTQNLSSGFEKTGIFPFAPNVIFDTVYRAPALPPASIDITQHTEDFRKIEEILSGIPNHNPERAKTLTDTLARLTAGIYMYKLVPLSIFCYTVRI